MTVLFYDEGEHPAGFVGYRVATSLGRNNEYRQKYFSLNQYSEHEARLEAQRLGENWRE
ncbi:hypothetical protein AB4254_11030 [Vibrio breoganii]